MMNRSTAYNSFTAQEIADVTVSPKPRKKKAAAKLGLLAEGLSEQDIHRQLEHVLASDTFQRAERLSRFLRHVVEQALAGQESALKEYSIGLSVFDKPESFDTRVDPIVRVEAGRLRAKIRDYYETEGSNDEIWLGLRKRGYRPAFRRLWPQAANASPAPQPDGHPVPPLEAPARLAASTSAASAAALPVAAVPNATAPAAVANPRTIAVLPFEDLSPEKTQEYFCDGITQEIVNSLAKTNTISVAARTSTARFRGEAKDVREIGRELQVGRILEGSVQKIGHQVRISAHLVDANSGFDCWAETYDRPLEDVLAIQDEIAHAIAEALQTEIDAAPPEPQPN